MTAAQLVQTLASKNLTITTAESCTGGLIAAAITDVSGASAVFKQGVVTYANESKIKLLGVDAHLLRERGAVSEAVAIAMAQGALKNAGADIAVAVTGIAGPTGGTPQKPVGLVFIGVATHEQSSAHRYMFSGDREKIRAQAAQEALKLALEISHSFSYCG